MPDQYFMIGAKRWAKRTKSALMMRRLDRRPVGDAPGELRLYMVIRNEMLRLPYFYEYYRGLGIDRFFIVDNNSDDGTTDYLLEQPDTHVYGTEETYTRQEQWVDWLLRKFGRDRWSIVVDVDELLVYPHMDRVPLKRLCELLGGGGYDAFHCLQLDMYPDTPLKEAAYKAGDPFLPSAPFFDPDSHEKQKYPYRNCRVDEPFRFVGGVRRRVFGLQDVCCSKFPVVRFHPGFFLRQGTHAVEGASIADARGALLHFKYLSDFGPRVKYEAVRGEHWNGAIQYKAYARKVEENESLRFWGPHSARYESPAKLLDAGLMTSAPWLDAAAR